MRQGVRIEATADHSSNQRNALHHVDRSSLARLRDQPKADLLVDLDKQLARDTADKRFGGTFPDLDACVLKNVFERVPKQRSYDKGLDAIGMDIVACDF